MTYKILYAGNMEAMQQYVNDSIDLGWIPQGGICVAAALSSPNSYYYYQAITRMKDDQFNG